MRWLAFAFLLPGIALAQEGNTLLGAGLRSRPAYDGSGRQETDLVPVLRYYGEPWFARTTQGILEGGARIVFSNGIQAGVQLSSDREATSMPIAARRPMRGSPSASGAAPGRRARTQQLRRGQVRHLREPRARVSLLAVATRTGW